MTDIDDTLRVVQLDGITRMPREAKAKYVRAAGWRPTYGGGKKWTNGTIVTTLADAAQRVARAEAEG